MVQRSSCRSRFWFHLCAPALSWACAAGGGAGDTDAPERTSAPARVLPPESSNSGMRAPAVPNPMAAPPLTTPPPAAGSTPSDVNGSAGGSSGEEQADPVFVPAEPPSEDPGATPGGLPSADEGAPAGNDEGDEGDEDDDEGGEDDDD